LPLIGTTASSVHPVHRFPGILQVNGEYENSCAAP
jgi:hypothetical protein